MRAIALTRYLFLNTAIYFQGYLWVKHYSTSEESKLHRFFIYADSKAFLESFLVLYVEPTSNNESKKESVAFALLLIIVSKLWLQSVGSKGLLTYIDRCSPRSMASKISSNLTTRTSGDPGVAIPSLIRSALAL